MARVCGIDPGLFGAITIVDTLEHTVECFDMPIHQIKKKVKVKKQMDPYGLADILREQDITSVYLEEVGYMPTDGGQGAFTFGQVYGTVIGVCGGMNLSLTKVRPAVWKRALRCTSSKDQTIARAGELMPQCRVLWQRKGKKAYDEGRAESALIALYGLSDLKHLLQAPLTPIKG